MVGVDLVVDILEKGGVVVEGVNVYEFKDLAPSELDGAMVRWDELSGGRVLRLCE